MINRVKGKMCNVVNEAKRIKTEYQQNAREKAKEKARIESERLQAEKDALLALSEKELIVEAVLLLRGYNGRLKKLEYKQQEILDKIYALQIS